MVIGIKRVKLRKEVKHQMMIGIPKEKLTLIISTPETAHLLDWEHAKEFEYEDEMYDVVYSESKGDTIYYWCWEDHKESELNKELSYLFHKSLDQSPDEDSNNALTLTFFKTLYPTYELSYDLSPTVEVIDNLFTESSQNLPVISRSIDSPPPQS
tara:strand:+ start:771 stop:1235 length:465 start_codon:yes stop_codon:yes gene_type:complete